MPDLDFLTRRPFAHRGLHNAARGIYENSRAAFIAAIDHGYGIELDVQMSRDGQAVVFHDDTLERLTDHTGPVRALDATTLTDITLGTSSDTIEPLGDILALIAGRVPVLIEIKDQSMTLAQTDGILERAVAHAVAQYDGPAAVRSFNPHAMHHVRDAEPSAICGLTTCDFSKQDWPTVSADRRRHLAAILDYHALNACFVSHDVNDLANPALVPLREHGVPILCWTVRSQQCAVSVKSMMDNITFENFLA